MTDEAVTLSDEAAEHVAQFVADKAGDQQVFLRLGVRGGGCSGFQYVLALDERKDDDIVFESHGQQIAVDPQSLRYVKGSRIVWTESLMTQGFDVDNPNATAACGCGSSFRVDEGASGCSEPEGPAVDNVYA